MLFKIGSLVVVIFVVYILFFKRKTSKLSKDMEETSECLTCKTFVTKEDAITKNNNTYCCIECIK